MPRTISLLLLCFFCLHGYAQKCNCASELLYLENKVEANLPSYYDQVIVKNRQREYEKHKKHYNSLARKITDSSECIYLDAKYLSFFRDEHLSVNYKDSVYDFSWDDNDTAGYGIQIGKMVP